MGQTFHPSQHEKNVVHFIGKYSRENLIQSKMSNKKIKKRLFTQDYRQKAQLIRFHLLFSPVIQRNLLLYIRRFSIIFYFEVDETSNRKIKVNTLCKLWQKCYLEDRKIRLRRQRRRWRWRHSNNIIFPYFTALCASYLWLLLFSTATTYSISSSFIFTWSVTVEMYTPFQKVMTVCDVSNQSLSTLDWLEHQFLYFWAAFYGCNILQLCMCVLIIKRLALLTFSHFSLNFKGWLVIPGKFVITLSVDINTIYSKSASDASRMRKKNFFRRIRNSKPKTWLVSWIPKTNFSPAYMNFI